MIHLDRQRVRAVRLDLTDRVRTELQFPQTAPPGIVPALCGLAPAFVPRLLARCFALCTASAWCELPAATGTGILNAAHLFQPTKVRTPIGMQSDVMACLTKHGEVILLMCCLRVWHPPHALALFGAGFPLRTLRLAER
jgi:hypothetical protein